MTLKEALDYGREELNKAGICEAALDAWYLLEFVSHVSRAYYYGNQEQSLSLEEEQLYVSLIGERKKRIPLQHITGVQEFMGFLFHVNEHVLIPRQDTELLVETALDFVEESSRVLDMCTGSGCILLSILKIKKGAKGVGVDISEEALKVAKENSDLNEVACDFILSHLFENVSGTFNIIVSNPPYIKTSVIEELQAEVKNHDPILALDGKEDGLFFYKKIIDEASEYLDKDGMLLFEIGFDQGEDVKQLMEIQGFVDVNIKKDLTGLDRVVYGRVQ